MNGFIIHALVLRLHPKENGIVLHVLQTWLDAKDENEITPQPLNKSLMNYNYLAQNKCNILNSYFE